MKPAFIPPLIPPPLDYTDLIREIGKAHDAVSELNGILTNVPNPDLLTTPLLTKEAVLSSRIEGTQATIQDVFEYEAAEGASVKPEDETDVIEVVNYRRALRQGIKLLDTEPLSENLIKQLHATLMTSGRGSNRMPGEFRRTQVYIGAPQDPEHARFVPSPPHNIPELFSNLVQYLNSDQEKDRLVQIGVAHYQFEAIHPFMDGNGRIGRLLIPLALYHQQRLSYPLVYISEFFEENRDQYYDLLFGVSERGEWRPWLRFFLLGLEVQAQKTQITALKILDLYDRLKKEVATINSRYGVHLLDVIFIRPIVSSTTLKERLKAVSSQTIYSLIGKFTQKGILQETTGRRRNRTYVFDGLIKLLR